MYVIIHYFNYLTLYESKRNLDNVNVVYLILIINIKH